MKHCLTTKILLKRLAGSHFFPASNVVTLELAIKRGSADAQHLACQRFVTLHLLEDALNRRSLDIFQIGAGEPGGGSVVSQLRSWDSRGDGGGQIMEIDGPL